jgi:hypothetical protein
MSSRWLKRTAAGLFLAVALALPAHALPTRPAEPLGFTASFLAWAAEVWSTVQAQVSTPAPLPPEGQSPPQPQGDEGHMIDPNG